jgi:hypothetical protein
LLFYIFYVLFTIGIIAATEKPNNESENKGKN